MARFKLVSIAAVLFISAVVRAQDVPLIVLDKSFDISKVKTADAKASLTESGAIRVESGHQVTWPGVTLSVPADHRDLSKYEYLAADITNVGSGRIRIHCRVDNPDSDGTLKCNGYVLNCLPGETITLKVTLVRANPLTGKLIGMRGYPFAVDSNPLDPANISQILFFDNRPDADAVWEISNIRVGGEYHAPPDRFFPFIDTFGQYIQVDWPGKAHSVEELRQRREEEKKDIEKNPAPADQDRWGGYNAGPTLKATGFFHTEKYQGKWWFVDPDGKLFFSHGIDCVRASDPTEVGKRANYFADFPGKKPEFADCLAPDNSFNFAQANLKRKYGDGWMKQMPDLVHQRLQSWGMNTIGNWSDDKFHRGNKTVYTAQLNYKCKRIEATEGYWEKFPDPFDPGLPTSLAQSAEKWAKDNADDPWCLGIFVDNEMAWTDDDISLAQATLACTADQPAKIAFVAELKAKYTTIDKLNDAWGTTLASWDALLQGKAKPQGAKARADLRDFYSHIATEYFRTVRDVIKKEAPHQLYLGCRFADGDSSPLAASVAAKYCDVVTFNLYRKTLENFKAADDFDAPMMIGEFHFGALDRGMFHPGLIPVKDQRARAEFYKQYLTSALGHSQFVGCQWFQYQDEPTTGRFDGENYQIGFVDIADTPYPETIAASREIGRTMYKVRLGYQ